MTKAIKTFAASAVLGLALSAGAAVAPALAIDPDIDFYCFDGEDGETICREIADLQLECRLIDPDNTLDECKDVNGGHAAIAVPQTLQSLTETGADDDSGGFTTRR